MELTFNNISKKYGKQKIAINQLNRTLTPGVIGFLGPNGAGKSTLMNMIATLTQPSEGSILYNGHDIRKSPEKIQKDLGYLPQSFGVFPNLGVSEFLTYLGLIKGLPLSYLKKAIPEFLDVFNLSAVSKKKVSSLSGGMKQRVGIIQALLGDPKIILLDEPTVGLDPEERINFRNLLDELSKDKIILLSSHIVSDIEMIADSIMVMKSGKELFYGDFEKAISSMLGKVSEDIVSADRMNELKKGNLMTDIKRMGNRFQVRYLDRKEVDKNLVVTPTLEDLYMYLTDAA